MDPNKIFAEKPNTTFTCPNPSDDDDESDD